MSTIDDVRSEIEDAPLATETEVEQFRIRFLGRKSGILTSLFKQIANIPPEERAAFGQSINELKQRAQERLDEAELAAGSNQDTDGRIDLTLPGRRPMPGSIHPLTQTLEEIKTVFSRMGFSVAEGPEIEDDWHNFTALNFPPDHPARDMQDTFFIESPGDSGEGILLRTHTSPVQIRVMEAQAPPVKVLVPGRVYRNEAISYKSFCLFHQVEGLFVDEGVSFADLKQVLFSFARTMFGEMVNIRFRPSFFPFTEPSAEVDIWWENADHPQGGQWLEILGCGMVDPKVLEMCGVDAERYTGYAFGMGVERIAMLKHGIRDIRAFYENDVRFLQQF
jgi:phenylalanyl-tRNA synthetase alpha chain